MQSNTRVLIIDIDANFYKRTKKALSDFNIEIDLIKKIESSHLNYDFYFLGEVVDNVISCVEKIREVDPVGRIFVFDCNCNDTFPLKKVLHLNISGCVEKSPQHVSKTVGATCKAKSKMCEITKRLDELKKGILEKSSIPHKSLAVS